MIRSPGRPQAVLLALLFAALPRAAIAHPPESTGGVRLELTEPKDYEVIQRTQNGGLVPVQGSWEVPKDAAAPDRLEARLIPAGSPQSDRTAWTPLPFDARALGFRTALPLKTAGWYELQVRVWRNHAPESTVIVPHIGLGEVFVVLAGPRIEAVPHPSGRVAIADKGRWGPLEESPSASISWVASLAESLAAKAATPVGLICLSADQTGASDWLPANTPVPAEGRQSSHAIAINGGGLVSDGVLFCQLTGVLAKRSPYGLRAVLWAGPTDSGQREGLLAVMKASRSRLTLSLPWFAPGPLAAPDEHLYPIGTTASAPSWTETLDRSLDSPW